MTDVVADFDGPAGQAVTIWQPSSRVTLDGAGCAVMPNDDVANNPTLKLVDTEPAAGRAVAVEWEQLGAPANGYAVTGLRVARASDPANYYAQVRQSGGKLLWQAYAYGGTQSYVDFDAAAHRHWRLRFAERLYVEASADGATWKILGILTLPTWVSEACVYTVTAGPWDARGVSSTPNLLRAFTRNATPPSPAGIVPFRTEEMLSPTSFWRKPLAADVPLLADRRWARNLCAQMDLDPDTPATAKAAAQLPGALPGNAWFNMDAGGSPLYVVGPDVPTQRVTLIRQGNAAEPDLQASWEAVPVPEPITVGNSSDKSVCIWQPSSGTMWEFWVFEGTPGAYTARWGGTMKDAATNIGVYQNQPPAFGTRWQWNNWGHTASSLPINAGAIQPEELDRGYIGHALHMVAGWTAKQFVWPAQRCDGPGKWYLRADGTWGTWRSGAQWLDYPDLVPEGCRLRFPADLDSSPYTGLTKMLVEAVRDYGLIVTDQTGQGCGIRFRESSTYKAAGQPNPWPSRITKWPHEYMWAMPWHRLQVIDPAVR